MTIVFKLVELIYRGVNRARRAWYRFGLTRKRFLPRPVVSVGNIAIGGGGKTPTTIAIANALNAKGLRVAVLTRGYGGSLSESVGRIVVPPFDPSSYGDEPVLIARRAPEVDVVVGARRWVSGLTYLVQRDCDVFLLDDGFQHLQLRRDVDIVLDRPSARWHREGRSALRDANYVLRRVDRPEDDGEMTARLAPTGFRVGQEWRSLEELIGKKVYVFSGLADNDHFVSTIEKLGGRVVGTRSFDDHHPYAREEIEEILEEARGLEAMAVTSEKDAVKIDNASIGVLEASMVIPSLDPIVEHVALLVRK